MGISVEMQEVLRGLSLPDGFSVCELGNQVRATGKRRIQRAKVKLTARDEKVPAEGFYRKLGCARYVSLDGNGRGTHTVDLNYPLAIDLGTFDLVTNFGTSEHCFNQAQVWGTIHDLTRPGGLMVSELPHQGFLDHGFYNVHPCLFRDLAAANGYEIVGLVRKNIKNGETLHAVLRRLTDAPFRYPNQGRYLKMLVI
jgi:SAM-dependent methyltransferase